LTLAQIILFFVSLKVLGGKKNYVQIQFLKIQSRWSDFNPRRIQQVT
jgi:hypothetical protein